MIKPIAKTEKEQALRYAKTLWFECKHCGDSGEITLTNSLIHLDENGSATEPIYQDCPNCGMPLNDEEQPANPL